MRSSESESTQRRNHGLLGNCFLGGGRGEMEPEKKSKKKLKIREEKGERDSI